MSVVGRHERKSNCAPPLPLSPQQRTFRNAAVTSALCATRRLVHRRKPRYSITSSARASSAGGAVSPSVLAVLRLMTSSNLVGS
jgi:hypothetical protein